MIAELGRAARKPVRPWMTGTAAVAGAILLLGGAAVGVRARAARGGAPATLEVAAQAQGPELVTDRPPPASTSAAAVESYRRALAAQRAGTLMTERRELLAATSADPDLAPAWLRLAITQTWTRAPTEARESYRRAVALRARLDERDQAMLDAYEPVTMEAPLDLDEHARRLAALTARFPRDAELAGALAYAVYRGGHWAEAIAAYDCAIALDPGQAEQFRFAGLAHAYLGDFDGARAVADACDKACPASGMCPMLRSTLSQQAGDCAALEAQARATILRTGDEGYALLAEAQASQHGAVEAVRETLRLGLQHMTEDARPFRAASDAVQVALWQGDFGRVGALAAEVERLASKAALEEEHGLAVAPVVEADLEMGRPADARRAAEDFLARRASWTSASAFTYGGLWSTVLPVMFAARAAGGAPRGEVDAQRAAFAREWEARLPAWDAHAVWFAAYAAPALTADDARAALAALVGFTPLPPYRGPTLWNADEGRVRWLAGDVAAGRDLLERGAKSCVALRLPVERMRAMLALGGAREADGDRAGACQAYGQVLAAWERATPRSVTADAAKERATRLGCGR